MNRNLDLVLVRIQEIDEIKEKLKQLEKVNAELEKSLEFAHESIKSLTARVDAQANTISELEKGVNNLTKSAGIVRFSVFSAALQVTKQVSQSCSITTLPTMF